MNNCRLIYKSRASTDVVSNEAMSHLAVQSAKANKARQISGLLLLAGNKYLQVLEGPYHDVNRLYGNIMSDTRHCDVELINTLEKYEVVELSAKQAETLLAEKGRYPPHPGERPPES